jgi:uroporphyrin-III C-methyltransferase / precorrin-2 dehydrogenase / sirohydrochlorin ferrochelatase
VDYFPIFMDLRGRPCLVVGGNEVAARKAALLLRAGARLRVLAADLSEEMRALSANPALLHEARVYRSSDLEDVALVIAASGDHALDSEISAQARARCVPVNVVDAPALCSFVVPALVERGALSVAIGTAGAAPVLARLARGKVEAALPRHYGDLVGLCAKLRAEVRHALPDLVRRRRFWEEMLEGEPAERVYRGELAEAEQALRAALERAAGAPARGEAFLIGAGPNDPELVSFRALRLLQRAEWVLHSAEVAPTIVDLSRRDAERSAFSEPLDAVPDALLQRMAAAVSGGRRVCVLAIGDAFRTPAGQSFAARATQLGVFCQVVPAIAP